MDSQNTRWSWWYRDEERGNCYVQNIWVVLSAISGIFLALMLFSFATMKIQDKNGVEKDRAIQLLKKYKMRFILWLAISFVVGFSIGNLILTYYCNKRPQGVGNLLWSLLLFFIVIPIVNSFVNMIIMYVLLGDLVKELQTQDWSPDWGIGPVRINHNA